MRIGSISFAAVDNYGAVLQAYALSRVLAQSGHQTTVLDYRIRSVQFFDRLRTMHFSYARHAPWPVFAAAPQMFLRIRRLEQFRRTHLNRTPVLYEDSDFRGMTRDLDAIITGSDEIFRSGSTGLVYPPFYLDFADPVRQKLVAYAACSGGMSDFGGENNQVAAWLNRFHHISVRDECTRSMVKHFTGRDPQMVLDPTLLWKFDELSLPEPETRGHVLVYGFFRSPETDRMVRAVADRLGVPMVSVGWASKYAHRNVVAADPLEWLACFKHAGLVFTNCFHGLMFSALYRRDFLIFESETARSKLSDFTGRFSLNSRLVPTGQSPTRQQLAGMDHDDLQRQLQPYVRDSLAFLETALAPAPLPAGVRAPEVVADTETAGLKPVVPAGPLSILGSGWVAVLLGWLLLGGIVGLHLNSNPHLTFIPLYLLPCAWLTWTAGRRWGASAALVAAITGPLIQRWQDADYASGLTQFWNTVMRFFIFQSFVLLLDNTHSRNILSVLGEISSDLVRRLFFSTRLVTLLVGWLMLAVVSVLHCFASPHLVFMPFYLIPCIWLTLAVNRRWGTLAALVSALIGPLLQQVGDPDYASWNVWLWNSSMRFVLFETVVLLVDRLGAKTFRSAKRRLPAV